MVRLHALSRRPAAAALGFLTLAAIATAPVWGSNLVTSEPPASSAAAAIYRLVMATSVAALALGGVAIAGRLRREDADVKRMRRELHSARLTQERFLPQDVPHVPGLDLWGMNLSSNEVSGDYYDIRCRGAGQPVVLAIADVSGKGMPAALLMSAVQAGLQSQLLAGAFELGRTMRNLNQLVCENATLGRFVTMLLAEIDRSRLTLRYVRAGHDYPIVVSRDGAVRRLSGGETFLGLQPDVAYRAESISLAPGDTLCLYTDGVTEAADARGEMFEEARLVDVIVRHRAASAAEIGREVLRAVSAHSGRPHQSDDVTLVIVKIDALESSAI
ncbi:MAG: PP2C family protein-serine/threonine phosphatase [bacterium]